MIALQKLRYDFCIELLKIRNRENKGRLLF